MRRAKHEGTGEGAARDRTIASALRMVSLVGTAALLSAITSGYARPAAGQGAVEAGAPSPSLGAGAADASTLVSDDKRSLVAEDELPIHGSFGLRERGRWSGGAHDHDLYATLYLDVGDASKNPWTGHLSAQAIRDLDGASGNTSPFFSLEDAQGTRTRGYVYEAYAERHGAGGFDSLRFGRQTMYETPVFLWFDGASARTKPLAGRAALQFGAYGGESVRQFESGSRDERVLGLWSSFRPWTRATARLDWAHIEDPERLGGTDDDLVQAALGQGVGEHLRLDTAYSRLENRDRDVSVRAIWADAETDVSVNASWYRLLATQGTLALDLDPFTSALLEQFPYWESRASVSKGFGERVRVDVGVDLRRVTHEADQGLFNHDFDRRYATLTLSKLPLALELALTGEIWDGNGDEVHTWGADLSRKWGRSSSASVGTNYALYKFDLFDTAGATEREDVRVWYARWRVRNKTGLGWQLAYEYEDDPGVDVQTLRIGATWKF